MNRIGSIEEVPTPLAKAFGMRYAINREAQPPPRINEKVIPWVYSDATVLVPLAHATIGSEVAKVPDQRQGTFSRIFVTIYTIRGDTCASDD